MWGWRIGTQWWCCLVVLLLSLGWARGSLFSQVREISENIHEYGQHQPAFQGKAVPYRANDEDVDAGDDADANAISDADEMPMAEAVKALVEHEVRRLLRHAPGKTGWMTPLSSVGEALRLISE